MTMTDTAGTDFFGPSLGCTTVGDYMWWLFQTRVVRVPLTGTGLQAPTVFPSLATALPETCGFGANIMSTIEGQVVWYTGSRFFFLADESNVDPADRVKPFPAGDDGLGRDFLEAAQEHLLAPDLARLAFGTPQGVWWVKNTVSDGGLPQAFMFRLNRQIDGGLRP